MRQLLQRRVSSAVPDETAAAAVQLLDGEVLQHGVQEKEIVKSPVSGETGRPRGILC